MSKVNLSILEVNEIDFTSKMEWDLLLGKLGSSPRRAGEVVEGMTVPQGKIWLFPLGSNFQPIEKVIKGVRIIKSVNV